MESIKIKEGVELLSERAVYLRKEKTLIISDLHIGIEESSLVGIRVQTKDMIKRIKDITREYEVEKIVLNGDIKYSFSKEISQEYEGIRKFIDSLSDFEIIPLKGNHDFYIQNIFRDRGEVREYVKIGDVLITHGHKLFDFGQKLTIIGNEHPSLTFIDEVGVRVKVPCFMVFDSLIVEPAFNKLSKGVDILRTNNFLSPYLKEVNIEEAKIVVVNEDQIVDFGKLKKLREVFL